MNNLQIKKPTVRLLSVLITKLKTNPHNSQRLRIFTNYTCKITLNKIFVKKKPTTRLLSVGTISCLKPLFKDMGVMAILYNTFSK